MGTDVNNNSLDTSFIPKGWEARQLDSISKIVDSLHQTPKFSDDGYAMVRVSDIKSGKLNLSGTLKVSEKIYRDFTKNHQPKKGDIVLSRVGSYGVSSFVATEEPFCLGQNTVVLEPHIENEFLYYSLNTQHVQQQIELQSYGTGYKSLSLKNIKELILIIPKSKSEQSAITTALSDTDALIENLEKLIEKKRNINIATRQRLFIPEKNWVVKKIGSCFQISSGISKSKFIEEDGQFIIMDMGSVSSEGHLIKTKRTNYGTDFLDYGDLIMPKDDIGGGNIIGKVGFIDGNGKYVLGDHVYKLKAINEEIDALFFYYLINSHLVNRALRKKVTGSAQLGLGKKSVEEQDVLFPPLKSSQKSIARILSDIDSEIFSLEQKLQKYRMIKQGMMQVLLTGKIQLL